MTKTIIFCHGFGLDKSVFDPLKSLFSEYHIIDWDLGYFGSQNLPISDNAIGIGHSLGFLKLYQKKKHFSHLVSLGGFFDFICESKIRKKALDYLIKQFEIDPKIALSEFYHSMNFKKDIPKPVNQDRLLEDLEVLKTALSFQNDKRILSLFTNDDPIVTNAVSKKNFGNVQNFCFQDGGHLFIDKHKIDIAEKIKHFILET